MERDVSNISTSVVAIAAATLLGIPLVLVSSTAARAYDYCYQDVTGHMKGCSFDTMEQCEAMRSGRGGDCFRDPFLKDRSNAHAYQPLYLDSKGLLTRPKRAVGTRAASER